LAWHSARGARGPIRQRAARAAGLLAPLSFASITYSDTDGPAPVVSAQPFTRELGTVAPTVPTEWRSLTAPVPVRGTGPDRLTVEPGSHLVSPAMVNMNDCVFGSTLAILRIDKNPDDVLMAYRRQFVRLSDGLDDAVGKGIQRGHDGGALALRVSVLGDELSYALTTFVRDGQPTWGVFETCSE